MRRKQRWPQNELARNGPDAAMNTQATPIMPNLAPTRREEALNRGGDTEGRNMIRTIVDLVRDVDQNPGLIGAARQGLAVEITER